MFNSSTHLLHVHVQIHNTKSIHWLEDCCFWICMLSNHFSPIVIWATIVKRNQNEKQHTDLYGFYNVPTSTRMTTQTFPLSYKRITLENIYNKSYKGQITIIPLYPYRTVPYRGSFALAPPIYPSPLYPTKRIGIEQMFTYLASCHLHLIHDRQKTTSSSTTCKIS